MTYDLLLRNGRIIDGSGMPAFSGDVGVTGGKIVEIGKLGGTAQRVIDVQGQAIAPGFIDNHCHFDGQVLWDPALHLLLLSRQHDRDQRELLAGSRPRPPE